MRSLFLLFSIIVAGCHSEATVHTHGMDLTEAERSQLEHKVAAGDAAAAWRLFHYFSLEHHDETAADPWLRRAAELKHPQAQRLLSYLIKDCNYSFVGFGSNSADAVHNLLSEAAKTEGDACYELASAYAEGYFGSSNQVKARTYYQQGAALNNRMCWERLSYCYRHGLGGPRDDPEAYYWISLEARCVDPRSVGGKETWQAREEIASHLSLAELEREWKRIDAFISQVAAKKITVDSAPFLSGMIDPKVEAEGRRFSQEYEDEHRKKSKSKNG